MNYFKIVILSLLFSIHCGIQSSTLGDLDDDFLYDILETLSNDDFYQNNAIEVTVNNGIEAQQNNHNLITPSQAGQKAYDDVYRQLRRTNELDDSEHNKRAKAAATKARNVAYHEVYYVVRKHNNHLTKSKKLKSVAEQYAEFRALNAAAEKKD